MKIQKALIPLLVLLGVLSGSVARAQDGLVISEFMADNTSAIQDDFGSNSDYVELYNGTAAPINLSGYYLTDTLLNLTQWKFPATNILSGQHLLVWVSGRDRKLPGAALHTNFRLNANGEQLALVKPDGTTVVHSYTFGYQAPNRSYGLAVEVLSSTSFVASGAAGRWFVPTNNTLSNRWTLVGFDDAAWQPGTTGLGFDTNPAALFAPFVKTDVRLAMTNSTIKRTSLFLRIPFNIADLTQVLNPFMQVRWDDGFVAYLNGVEIARRGFPTTSTPVYTSAATTNRANDVAIIPEGIFGREISTNLRQGDNVLAIHAINRSGTDGDFLILPELAARSVRYIASQERYFASPTPGSANASNGFEGQGSDVEFSAKSTTFFNNFELTLSAPEATQLGQIRYTINGTVPTTNSTLYTGPINITNSVPIRARAFEPGFLPGPVRTETFVKLNPAMRDRSSDVPMVIVHTFGGGGFSQDTLKSTVLFIHEPVQGRASFTNAPDQVFRAGLKIRGSSTAGNAKYNWAVHIWDENDANMDLPLLGMPADNEWVFHAPFSFDPSLIHNPLASDMSNEIGRYASRYSFAEIYLNESVATSANATLSASHYFGLYNIMERISLSPDRVDAPRLKAGDVAEPDVTGGYLMSVDRNLGSDTQLTLANQTVNMLDPQIEDLQLPQRKPQLTYITKFMNEFGTKLNSKDWTNPVTGYLPYIDRGAWIDHNIMMVISFNVDALRLSAYLYKQRNGPIVYGPIWDFDRAFGSTDGRDADPFIFSSSGGTDFFGNGTQQWWDRLFLDPAFWQAYIDRYQELREGLYSTPNIYALMDRLNAKVKESSVRDLARWGNAKRGGTQDSEMAFFKDWMKKRFLFMDTNFLAKPFLSHPGGQVSSDATISLNAGNGDEIYYTTDGTDPRLSYGAIAPNAKRYTAPIAINGEVRLVARARNVAHKNLTGAGGNPQISSPWSGPRSARYVLDAFATRGDLIINELNYNPAAPTDAELLKAPGATSESFEFIEIKNISNHRVDLFGAHFTQGVDFRFDETSTYVVEPGGLLLLVKNRDAFVARYGQTPAIAGVYTGALNDQGDSLRLVDAFDNELLELTYNNSWHPATDGFGFTLVRADGGVGDSSRYHWRASSATGGSPGADNPAAPALPLILVNEVLASSTGNQQDSIELLNRSGSLADVGGWFLTDDRNQPKKYRIPTNTKISAGGFLVITEKDFNANAQGTNAFQLSSRGDEAWLFAADAAGNLLGYSHGFSFDASEAGVSFGRHLLSTGKEVFPAQKALSLGAANAGPKVGPLVIREIHYHPLETVANGQLWDNTDDEYIEVQNITALPLSLYDTVLGAEWHVRGDADFNFPTNTTLAGNEVVLLVAFNPVTKPDQAAAFRAKFGIADNVRLMGPLNGTLPNGSGAVRITKPSAIDPDTEDTIYVVQDEVEYVDQAPWPIAADGSGASLQKLERSLYGADPASWIAALPTPGGSFAVGQAPTISQQPVGATVVGGTSASLTVGVEGVGPFKFLWRRDGTGIDGGTNATLTLNPVQVSDAGAYQVVVANASGSVESAIVTLNVLQPATIITPPDSKNVKPGGDITLSVDAIGTGPLSYVWYFNGTVIPGTSARTLLIKNAQLNNTGVYSVKVTDSIGSATSPGATVLVLVRPSFVLQPQSMVAVVGDTVQFETRVAGLPPFGYQWRRSSTSISRATNRIFRITNVQLSNAGIYTVTVANPATAGVSGTNSAAAVLVVMSDADQDGMGDAWELQYGFSPSDPTDAAQDADGDGHTNLQEFLAGTNPKDKNSLLRIDSIAQGTNGTAIGFVARTNRSYTVQFREALNRGQWLNVTQVPGRTNERPVSILDTLPESDTRFYRVIAPQQFDDVLPTGPVLLSSPVSQTVDAGDPVSFEVQAVGQGELRYQWRKGAADLIGETRSTLDIASASPTDSDAYSVRVTDDLGTLVTEAAQLTVLEKATITQQPASQTLNTGDTLTLSVQATGNGTLSYQWYVNNKAIAGETQSSLTIPNVTLQNAGSYRVAVKLTNANGALKVSSDTAVVRINE